MSAADEHTAITWRLAALLLFMVTDTGASSSSSSTTTTTTTTTTTCAGAPQVPLRYNVDDYTAASVGLPDAPSNESLSDAICCDPVYGGYPEPKGLYAQRDVSLFRKTNSSGVTTFYDSVCGIPLFRAPVGRTFEEWEAETQEHGWPSFRVAEVVDGNVVIGSDGVTVTSACGTKLGTNEPDDAGDRWCMDLVCISGSPSSSFSSSNSSSGDGGSGDT